MVYHSEKWIIWTCCQKYQIPELENSASQPCSPDFLKTLTPISSALCLLLPLGLTFWITDFKNSVCNFSVLFFLLPCVFLCLFVKVKNGGDNGRQRKESGWDVLGDRELRLQNNLKSLKSKPGMNLKDYLVFPSFISK